MLNRREFLSKIIQGAIGASAVALVNIDVILDETSLMSDDKFVDYITITMNMIVHNPRYCVVITNIGE